MNKAKTSIFPAKCIFKVSSNVLNSAISQETVMLNIKSGTYFGLNEVGTKVWELIGQSKTVWEIRNELLAEYEVSEEECDRDLQKLLQELVTAELIEMACEDSTGSYRSKSAIT